MKFSGYDAIVLSGVAKRWLYLYLHDGTAELRDAQHLLGKDTWETEDAIKAELGYSEKGMSVHCIGPAGENLVRFAGIFGDKDHVAGHNGVGAVMGSKKLKAFCAARGRAAVPVHSPKLVSSKAKAMWDVIRSHPWGNTNFHWGTSGDYGLADFRVATGTLPVKNYTTNLYPEARLMTSQYARQRWSAKPNPCWACRMHHCHMITFTDGRHAGQTVQEPEYEMYAAWGPLVGNHDPAEALIMTNLLTQLGLEGNEAGFLVSMLMELYEKGILTPQSTDGIELTWGNMAAIRTLLERIAHREGPFANILAEGTMRTAEVLGAEAQSCGVYTMKGHSPRGHDHRALWREMLDTATSDIATYESLSVAPPDPELPSLKDGFSAAEVSTYVAQMRGRRQFEDTLGTCIFCTRVPLRQVVEVLNAVTGWDFDIEEAQKVGFRVANLLRAFNLRHGITPDTEYPSQRWSSSPTDGPIQGITIAPHWDSMLDNYYSQMGWDRSSGRPLPETLCALGLDDVVKELWPTS